MSPRTAILVATELAAAGVAVVLVQTVREQARTIQRLAVEVQRPAGAYRRPAVPFDPPSDPSVCRYTPGDRLIQPAPMQDPALADDLILGGIYD